MLYLGFYIIEVFFFVILERKIWGTFITPSNCFSIPTAIAILLAIVYPYISPVFSKFYFPAISIWIVGLMMFEIISIIFSKSIKKQMKDSHETPRQNNLHLILGRKEEKIYTLLSVIGSFFILYALYKMRGISGTSWGSDDFSEQYSAGGGLLAHISVFICAIFGYMIYKADKNHKFAFLYIVMALLNMYAVGVKSWIIVPFLSGILARIISGKSKFSLKLSIYTIAICFLIFIVSYIIIMVVSGQSEFNMDFILFLIDHFMYYLIGGPLSFSIDYQQGLLEPDMFEHIFAPFINIYHLFTGDSFINPINPVYIDIGHSENNVRTAIGTIFAYSHSMWSLIVIIMIVSIIIYTIFTLTFNSKNPFLIMANSCNLVLLMMGFFDFYWLILNSYEICAIYLLLSFIYKYYPINTQKTAANLHF